MMEKSTGLSVSLNSSIQKKPWKIIIGFVEVFGNIRTLQSTINLGSLDLCYTSFCGRKTLVQLTMSIWSIGMRNAIVFPLPVTASAATSLFVSRRGIQAAWKHEKIEWLLHTSVTLLRAHERNYVTSIGLVITAIPTKDKTCEILLPQNPGR